MRIPIVNPFKLGGGAYKPGVYMTLRFFGYLKPDTFIPLGSRHSRLGLISCKPEMGVSVNPEHPKDQE